VGFAQPINHAAEGVNGTILVGMFVCLCFASQNPSRREIFDLAVKLLTAIAGHD